MNGSKYRQTFEQILARNNTVRPRKHPAEVEHHIQCACVRWFCYQHPEYKGCLFSVPNGGRRDKVTAAKLKAEGVVPGVSDLLFLVPNKKYHGLCIEMKDEKGRQSESQKEWQKTMVAMGYNYVVCRSLDDFIREVDGHLSNR